MNKKVVVGLGVTALAVGGIVAATRRAASAAGATGGGTTNGPKFAPGDWIMPKAGDAANTVEAVSGGKYSLAHYGLDGHIDRTGEFEITDIDSGFFVAVPSPADRKRWNIYVDPGVDGSAWPLILDGLKGIGIGVLGQSWGTGQTWVTATATVKQIAQAFNLDPILSAKAA